MNIVIVFSSSYKNLLCSVNGLTDMVQLHEI